MAEATRNPKTHRFEARGDVHSLYAYVRDVALTANPSEPWKVSKRAFDAARRADERFAGGLSADGVQKRLGYPWSQLMAVVTDSARDPERSIAARNRREARPVISFEEAVAALRLVAARIGTNTLRPHEYDHARGQAVEREASAWLHGRRLEKTLPTADQIDRALRLHDPPRTWDDCLRAAGLEARAVGGGRRGMSWPELIDMFMEELGFVPNWQQAKDFAAAKGISAERHAGRWERHLKEARARRRTRGATIPRRRMRGRLDISGISVVSEGAPRRTRNWTYDACIDGLVLALEAAGARPLTQRLLKQLAKGNPAIPTYSVIQRAAKREGWPPFPEMRAEAARRRAHPSR